MKPLVLVATLGLLGCSTTQVIAESKPTNVYVNDIYNYQVKYVPKYEEHCYKVDVPVYGEFYRDDNGAGAVGGAIIGGVIGNQFGNGSGKDAMTILGALLGANQGASAGKKIEREIVGWRSETQCDNVETRVEKQIKTYSHSVITFTINGVTYTEKFVKK